MKNSIVGMLLTCPIRKVWCSNLTANVFLLSGTGIRIACDVVELLTTVDAQDQSYVIQRYIERPMLLPDGGGRKFDIRLWVIIDPLYNIHVYSEGVVRTCSGKARHSTG